MADGKPVDTEGARKHLRFANQYFDKWTEHESNIPGGLEPDMHERVLSNLRNETFQHVLKYTKLARQQDPDVTLQIKDSKGELITITPDTIESTIYLMQGQFNANIAAHEYEAQNARALMQTAINMRPSPEAYAVMARSILYNEKNRKLAAQVATDALKKYPDDFELREILDLMEVNQKVGANPTSPQTVLLFLGLVSLIAGIILLIFNTTITDKATDVSIFLSVIALLAGVMFWIMMFNWKRKPVE